ncbi:E3 ubiquitin-protein ligase TRIM56-like [Stylophora pistillata]|uniref:E3 ubiquitin-protein ligase TRIM56-like n=1 Tax=Stylophora pistillata TaxID=50429 RepID=UPI000C04A95F|nr:E3 ubiquitin-protein ligase TRIM56-like [Stylophora pistillata]
METLLKNLKEYVTCSICLDTYTKPKTIACLHTFCCECLERHAQKRKNQELYPCPECQAQIRIPEGDCFDNLPSSFLHNSLLSLLAVQNSGEGNEISCSTCQRKSAEINYCFECEKFMCPDCVKAHEVFRDTLFEGHKVTPVRQFEAADYEALLKRQSFCSVKYHEKEVAKFSVWAVKAVFVQFASLQITKAMMLFCLKMQRMMRKQTSSFEPSE